MRALAVRAVVSDTGGMSVTYKTGLQFDNKTSKAIVWGSIKLDTGNFELSTLKDFFVGTPDTTTHGNWVTVSGAMDIPPGAYRDKSVEIVYNSGYVPIQITLKFSDGHTIAFEDAQRNAYNAQDKPQPVHITQTRGTDFLCGMRVSWWSRTDSEIEKIYDFGLVTYVINEHADTTDWMGRLPDRTLPLSAYTLPGTHDTGTWTLDGNPQCQTLILRRQLDEGVRFIDIRLEVGAKVGDDLEIYHGPKETGVKFRTGVLAACSSFLTEHSGETLIMMISQNRTISEGLARKALEKTKEVGENSNIPGLQSAGLLAASKIDAEDRMFASQVDALISDPIFLKTNQFPTLDQAAGRIVLITRYPYGPGIALRDPPDDDFGQVTEGPNTFDIQDVYGFGFSGENIFSDATKREKVDKKWGFVEQYLLGAQAEQTRRNSGGVLQGPSTGGGGAVGPAAGANIVFINYASASGPPGVLDPVDFAHGIDGQNGINQRLVNYLTAHPKGYYGAVMLDFPEFPGNGDVIRLLIESNG